MLVGENASGDAENAGDNVGRDSHQLSSIGSVAKSLDDGGEKQRERIEWRVDSNGDEHVHPDLPVTNGVVEVLEVILIGERAAIEFEATLDFGALRLAEKLGSIGIVVHQEERTASNNKGDDS